MKTRFSILIGICLMVLGLHVVQGTALADQDLLERAQVFWEAQVMGDWATVYQFLPEDDRSRVSQEEFTAAGKKKAPFRYESIAMRGAETSGHLGWVKVAYTVMVPEFPLVPPRKMEIWQVWEKTEEGWLPVLASRKLEAPGLPPSQRPAVDEAELANRVHEFWEAMRNEQWSIIYTYCDPEFRKAVTQEEFLEKKALYKYLAHSVEWVEVSGDRGKAKVDYVIRPNDPYLAKLDPANESIVENWIKFEGRWYHLISQ